MPEPLEFEDAWYVTVTVQTTGGEFGQDLDQQQRVWIELTEPHEQYMTTTLTIEQAGAVRDWLTQFLEENKNK